jgi:flagellar motor switch protein FliG
MALSGREKATILLSILGADVSTRVIRFLPDDMADLLVSGVNDLPKPSPEAISVVINEFRRAFSLPGAAGQSAIEAGTPASAPPPQREKPRAQMKPKELLNQMSGRALTSILLKERPQTVAFVLMQLPEARASEVLTYLPEQRTEIEYLLQTIKMNPLTEKIKDSVLETVAKRLS